MIPELYDQYFIQKQDERRHLFQLVAEQFQVKSGIYPGSFVHITPAFYIPEMAFIDSDRRINKFFQDDATMAYIEENKEYDGPAKVSWSQSDYTSATGIQEGHFDIMFSFYAGFISQDCKKYLKHQGILMANNSHGDASLALADTDYEALGVVLRNGDRFRIKSEGFQDFITKKDKSEIDVAKVTKRMVGERFSKSAFAIIFRKIN